VGSINLLLWTVRVRVPCSVLDEQISCHLVRWHYDVSVGRHTVNIFRGPNTYMYDSILWGIAEMCLGATQNWLTLAAARFFLGFTEGAVAPSFMVITSGWYKRSEHPVRIA
jgi:MFS family permease